MATKGSEPGGEPAGPWLVVGLGNPGGGYAGNRHNVGFVVADVLASRMGARFRRHRARAQVVEGRLGVPGVSSYRVVVAKPQAFMNLSGGPVSALCSFYRVPLERLVVVHDELDLGFGVLRLKQGGGDNGHNGLKSLSSSLGREYHRVRFGVGRPPGRMDVADYVLRDFPPAERREVPAVAERAADAVQELVLRGLGRAQDAYNA